MMVNKLVDIGSSWFHGGWCRMLGRYGGVVLAFVTQQTSGGALLRSWDPTPVMPP